MSEYNFWLSSELARIRREDRMREAVEYHQASIAMRIEPKTDTLVSRLIYSIGTALYTLGGSLKQRYQRDDKLTPCPAGDCQ